MILHMRRPPSKLVERLVGVSEEVLRPDRALRLEDVAALIGSARATLYYHFSGRDDLVAFLLEEHLRVAAETVELAVTPTGSPAVRLRSAITALVGFLGGQPGVCAGLLSFAGATGRLGTLMAAKDAKLATPLQKLLDEGRHRPIHIQRLPRRCQRNPGGCTDRNAHPLGRWPRHTRSRVSAGTDRPTRQERRTCVNKCAPRGQKARHGFRGSPASQILPVGRQPSANYIETRPLIDLEIEVGFSCKTLVASMPSPLQDVKPRPEESLSAMMMHS